MRDLEEFRNFSPKKLYSLDGQVALVTGVAGGIGSWLAGGLVAAGANVVLTDIDQVGLDRVADVLGDKVTAIHADLTDREQREALGARAASFMGGLNILVNCAGINIRKSTAEVTEEEYDKIMLLNLKVPFFLTQAVLPHLVERRGGSVVHIGSVNGFQGLSGVGVYGPAKAALEQLTKVQIIEWARLGVRVNCLAPGFMDTPLTKPLQEDRVRSSWIRARVPQGRFGDPSELVGPLLFLVSKAGSYLTGQTIYVDGGFTAGSDWHLGGPALPPQLP